MTLCFAYGKMKVCSTVRKSQNIMHIIASYDQSDGEQIRCVKDKSWLMTLNLSRVCLYWMPHGWEIKIFVK